MLKKEGGNDKWVNIAYVRVVETVTTGRCSWSRKALSEMQLVAQLECCKTSNFLKIQVKL